MIGSMSSTSGGAIAKRGDLRDIAGNLLGTSGKRGLSMCIGGVPDVPAPAERQSPKMPEKPGLGANGPLSRRRGYAALIKTATGGDLTPVATTAAPAAAKLGA